MTFTLNLPGGVIQDGHVVLENNGTRVIVAKLTDGIKKDGVIFADYVVQGNNLDYGWVDSVDDNSYIVNLFELPQLSIVDGEIVMGVA